MEEVREEGTVYVHATGAKECAVDVWCMCYRAVRGDLREGGVEGAGGTVGALPARCCRRLGRCSFRCCAGTRRAPSVLTSVYCAMCYVYVCVHESAYRSPILHIIYVYPKFLRDLASGRLFTAGSVVWAGQGSVGFTRGNTYGFSL